MSDTQARYYLNRLRKRYQFVRLAEVCLLSFSLNLVVFGICHVLSIGTVTTYFLSIGVGVIFFIIRSLQLKIFKIGEAELVSYMNRHYAQLEESSDLLLKDDGDLTSLQQLQKLRNIERFEQLYPNIKLPNKIGQASLLFALSIVLYVGLSSFTSPKQDTLSPTENKEEAKITERLPAFIKSLTISIKPPSYTRISGSVTSNADIKVAEGSRVFWRIVFEGDVIDHKIIFSGKDSVTLKAVQKGYEADRYFTESGFYQLAWSDANGRQYSDFYKIEVVKDQPPTITVENLNQFTELAATDNLKINLKSVLSDDYSISQAHIIATVSKGSGESVKFREEKLFFDTPSKVEGKNVRATRLIDLIKLGLEPGDELYFYIEAFDNKTPVAGRNRTETFFIALQDTARQETSIDAGLGVDLMPEYFRSQRQIIIDSEKLLKDKKQITKEAFNFKSNELGYDQKVLRLKYGEFMGEEFETGAQNSAPVEAADDHSHEDVVKNFGHTHDNENEHNLVADKKTQEAGHDHGAKANPNAKEDPLADYKHTHDDEEEATFFTQSIRAKLKAALTIMWDAELHLRLYDPEKSLPYQYKALKLLKEISQDSRVYVHRTGFDPPPLKEEKRLTGDLNEIENSSAQYQKDKRNVYPNIKQATVLIETLLQQETINLTSAQKNQFLKAGQELSAVALSQPGKYLKSLSLITALTENKIEVGKRADALKEIRKAFWNVLPHETTSPQVKQQSLHAIDQSFIRNLEALRN
jgi:hypothetical protein